MKNEVGLYEFAARKCFIVRHLADAGSFYKMSVLPF